MSAKQALRPIAPEDLVDILSAFLAYPYLLACIVDAMSYTSRSFAARADKHHVGCMQRCLHGRDTALRILLRRTHGFLHQVELLHYYALGLRNRATDLAFFAAILTSA